MVIGLDSLAEILPIPVPGEDAHGAVDRLVHHATILEMNVESYRRLPAQDS